MGLWQRLGRLFRKPHPDAVRFGPLERILGYRFKDHQQLTLGLTHRSAMKAGDSLAACNERLEFLGDSILGAVIAEQLYLDFPDKSEGHMTKIKSQLVNETTLSAIGREIGLNQFVFLSPDEERTGGRERASIISDAFEGVLGAIYLDGGFDAARDVILRHVYARRDQITSDTSQRNFKGELLEISQARGIGAPRYDVIAQEGPDHEKIFHVVVMIAGQQTGEGSGLSKKEAEQKAAAAAIARFQFDTPLTD